MRECTRAHYINTWCAHERITSIDTDLSHEEARKLQTTKMQLDLGTYSRVMTIKQNGLSYREIQHYLKKEDIKIPLVSLWKLVSKYCRTGSAVDRPCLRPPIKLSDDCYILIDNFLSENDELTTQMLLLRLKENNTQLDISLSTMKWARQELGWVSKQGETVKVVQGSNSKQWEFWCHLYRWMLSSARCP